MLDSPVTMPSGRAERAPLRLLGAALLLVDAYIHVQQSVGATDHPPLATAFAASALGMLAGAALLLTRAPRLGWLIGGSTAALTLLGFVLTRSVGVPLLDPTDDLGNWTETAGVIAAGLEVLLSAFTIIAVGDRHKVHGRIIRAEIQATTPGLRET